MTRHLTALPDNVVHLAIPGQDRRPGNPQAAERLARRLRSVPDVIGTCGHPTPRITMHREAGAFLVCRNCVLAAVERTDGTCLIDPDGGDEA